LADDGGTGIGIGIGAVLHVDEDLEMAEALRLADYPKDELIAQGALGADDSGIDIDGGGAAVPADISDLFAPLDFLQVRHCSQLKQALFTVEVYTP
jgi:hypothetical protein